LLRESALAQLAGADLILHAGDVGRKEVLDGLRKVAPVIAIRGNVDSPELDLAEKELVRLNRDLVYLRHDAGLIDINPGIAGIRAVIFGHSHKPSLEERKRVIYLNPGSIGPRRFKNPVSMARLDWPVGKLKARLIFLD
jgi:uncharacterized protein